MRSMKISDWFFLQILMKTSLFHFFKDQPKLHKNLLKVLNLICLDYMVKSLSLHFVINIGVLEKQFLDCVGSTPFWLKGKNSSLLDGMLLMHLMIQISRFVKIFYQFIWENWLMVNLMMNNMTKKLRFLGKRFSIWLQRQTMEVGWLMTEIEDLFLFMLRKSSMITWLLQRDGDLTALKKWTTCIPLMR